MQKLRDGFRKYWILYAMLLPTFIWYLAFAFKPLYYLQIALFDYNPYKGLSGSEFVGLDNFIHFFSGKDFFRTFKNTLVLGLCSILFEFPMAIIFSVMLNEIKNKLAKTFFQTVSFIPYFISIVVIAGIFINLLSPTNGVINIMLEKMGIERAYFISQAKYFRPIYIALNIWKNTGFNALVYLAALMGVRPELYEAARIDGAGKWQELWSVTLPSIMPTIIVMLILRIGSIMQVGYETILLLYQPSTFETADVISTFAYRVGLEQNNYGLAAAAGLFNSLIALVLIAATNKASKKYAGSSLW